MIIAEQIKKKLYSVPDGVILTLNDFDIDAKYGLALAKALSRLVSKGDLKKVSKGRYYKPRKTMFGELKPAPAEIVKDFLEKGGKQIGYITGTEAFASIGLTTQITSSVMIGTNKYRRPLQRGDYSISFLLQQNSITEINIPLLRILDAVRLIREIPASTPDDTVLRLMKIIKDLSGQQKKILCSLAEQYTPCVRALLGAIMEQNGDKTYNLKSSLNGVTTYKLNIADRVLLTKKNWNIV